MNRSGVLHQAIRSRTFMRHLFGAQETALMTSPCGAAGIEISQLVTFCGCVPAETEFEMEKVLSDREHRLFFKNQSHDVFSS